MAKRKSAPEPDLFGSGTPDNRQFADERAARLEQAIQKIPPKFRANYVAGISGESRKKAIRSKCLECVNWVSVEVRECTDPTCPLFAFRVEG